MRPSRPTRPRRPCRRLRPDRDGHLRLRAARARREPVQARRRDPRRRTAAGHLGGGSGDSTRRTGRRKRRGADSRAGVIQLRHRPAAGGGLCLPGRGGPARDGGALREFYARPRRASARRSRKSIACSASTASRSRPCAPSAHRSPMPSWPGRAHGPTNCGGIRRCSSGSRPRPPSGHREHPAPCQGRVRRHDPHGVVGRSNLERTKDWQACVGCDKKTARPSSGPPPMRARPLFGPLTASFLALLAGCARRARWR